MANSGDLLMNFIRKLAVKSYRKKIIHFTDVLSTMDKKQLANFVAFSVWIRSMLQVEGHINPIKRVNPSSDDYDLNPELHAYPFMLKDFENFIRFLNKQKQKSKSMALTLWTYTLKAIIRPELNIEINNLWQLLMTSREHWDEEIKLMHAEDIELGIDTDKVDKTSKMAKEIIKCLPPKQILPPQ
jgi:hypothetical protein